MPGNKDVLFGILLIKIKNYSRIGTYKNLQETDLWDLGELSLKTNHLLTVNGPTTSIINLNCPPMLTIYSKRTHNIKTRMNNVPPKPIPLLKQAS